MSHISAGWISFAIIYYSNTHLILKRFMFQVMFPCEPARYDIQHVCLLKLAVLASTACKDGSDLVP